MLLSCCLLITVLLQSLLQSLSFLHMLQLESYQNAHYARWCREHPRRVFPISRLLNAAALIVAAVLSHFGRLPASWTVAFCGIAVGLIGALPQKAKKPLVLTWRVRRMLMTLGGFAVLLAAAVLLSPVGAQLLLCAVWLCAVFLLVPAANAFNAPIERAIAQHFVDDARRRLREQKNLRVIGITGSYGKTSTKVFLQALLSTRYNVLMTPESYNTTMGVVRTVRERLLPTHEIFIAEMGAKNVGEIREICDIVHPQYGILTSIGEQHLESFGSVENIIRTKFELAEALPADGFLCLNTDNPYIAAHPVTNTRTVSYGVAADSTADYRAADITVGRDGSRFTVIAPDGEHCTFTTRLLGAHNIQNLLGCIALCHTLGIPLKKLVYPTSLLQAVPHRLQLLPNGFIDDAFNSNPAGFRSALDALSGFPGQRVLVTPGMVELGERQEALNEELGAYAAQRCDYAVLVGERQAPPLEKGLREAGFPAERIFVASSLQEALRHVAALPNEGPRTVLLENDLPDNYN